MLLHILSWGWNYQFCIKSIMVWSCIIEYVVVRGIDFFWKWAIFQISLEKLFSIFFRILWSCCTIENSNGILWLKVRKFFKMSPFPNKTFYVEKSLFSSKIKLFSITNQFYREKRKYVIEIVAIVKMIINVLTYPFILVALKMEEKH